MFRIPDCPWPPVGTIATHAGNHSPVPGGSASWRQFRAPYCFESSSHRQGRQVSANSRPAEGGGFRFEAKPRSAGYLVFIAYLQACRPWRAGNTPTPLYPHEATFLTGVSCFAWVAISGCPGTREASASLRSVPRSPLHHAGLLERKGSQILKSRQYSIDQSLNTGCLSNWRDLPDPDPEL